MCGKQTQDKKAKKSKQRGTCGRARCRPRGTGSESVHGSRRGDGERDIEANHKTKTNSETKAKPKEAHGQNGKSKFKR